MSFTAIYDACVLYPAPLRDFLMWLALTDLFRARWTEEIHAEWMRNVLNNRSDLTKEQLTRTKNLMNANVRDCLVTDYESLIETLVLPDLDDRHVLAAVPEDYLRSPKPKSKLLLPSMAKPKAAIAHLRQH